MRLREREKREVTIFDLAERGEDAYIWGAHRRIRAAVYPLGSGIDARVYGERIRQTRLMLYDGPEMLKAGMGVCVEKEEPDYRVAALERWDHWKATLEKI